MIKFILEQVGMQVVPRDVRIAARNSTIPKKQKQKQQQNNATRRQITRDAHAVSDGRRDNLNSATDGGMKVF